MLSIEQQDNFAKPADQLRFDFFTKENDRVVRLFQGNLRLKREKNIEKIIKRVDFLRNGLSL